MCTSQVPRALPAWTRKLLHRNVLLHTAQSRCRSQDSTLDSIGAQIPCQGPSLQSPEPSPPCMVIAASHSLAARWGQAPATPRTAMKPSLWHHSPPRQLLASCQHRRRASWTGRQIRPWQTCRQMSRQKSRRSLWMQPWTLLLPGRALPPPILLMTRCQAGFACSAGTPCTQAYGIAVTPAISLAPICMPSLCDCVQQLRAMPISKPRPCLSIINLSAGSRRTLRRTSLLTASEHATTEATH